MRDGAGNVITVCSMENFDPVGVHTGDSDRQSRRPVTLCGQGISDASHRASLAIITELGIEGGCNVQFALDPESFEYAVIEVNPVSPVPPRWLPRRPAIPIAKVADEDRARLHA
ncbi:MAG: hypothetical protein ACLR4Z_11960 [Butyricicoccaceae bacterium]